MFYFCGEIRKIFTFWLKTEVCTSSRVMFLTLLRALSQYSTINRAKFSDEKMCIILVNRLED